MKNVIIGMSVLAPTLFLSSCYVTSAPNAYYSGYSPTYAAYGWGGGGYYNSGWGGYRRAGWYGNNSGAWGHHGGWGYAGRHGGGGWHRR